MGSAKQGRGKTSKAKKSIRAAQGAPLPPDGSPIEAYPVGSCVLAEIDGEQRWWIIAFRIGGSPSPHCRMLRVPPSDAAWNEGDSPVRELPATTRVASSAWPFRVQAAALAGAEEDPLLQGLRSDWTTAPPAK